MQILAKKLPEETNRLSMVDYHWSEFAVVALNAPTSGFGEFHFLSRLFLVTLDLTSGAHFALAQVDERRIHFLSEL